MKLTSKELFDLNIVDEIIEEPTGGAHRDREKTLEKVGFSIKKHLENFENLSDEPEGFKEIKDARPLLILGDTITTDHISPAGSIQKESPTGEYFMKHQVLTKDYNSYGSRRGNHEVMTRGTFGNIRIKNEMASGTEGGFTKLYPEGKVMTVFEAVLEYKKRGTDLVVIAGKEYGTGSSRDWAAKGTKLLGIKAVLAESFERIHRSNLMWLISRETLVGLAYGILWAFVVALVATVWFQDTLIAKIIAIAMIINLMVAVISGVAVPSILRYFRIDPGIAGSVIVTTITDVAGFVSFLGLASLYYI